MDVVAVRLRIADFEQTTAAGFLPRQNTAERGRGCGVETREVVVAGVECCRISGSNTAIVTLHEHLERAFLDVQAEDTSAGADFGRHID